MEFTVVQIYVSTAILPYTILALLFNILFNILILKLNIVESNQK